MTSKPEYRLSYTLIDGSSRTVATYASSYIEALDSFYDDYCLYDIPSDQYMCPITGLAIYDVKDPKLVAILA